MIISTEKPKTAIVVLALCALLVVSQLYIPIPLAAAFIHYFSVNESEAIWIGSSFGFAYAAGFLVFGPLSDRFGRKALLVPGLFALGIVTFLIGFSTHFNSMVILRIIQGFVAATFAPAALAYVGEQLPITLRPTAIACISTGFMAAGVLGQLYASTIDLHFGWETIFWSLGCIYVVFAFLVAYTLLENKNVNNESHHKINLRSFYFEMVRHLANKNLVVAYLCSFVLLLNFVAMYTGLCPYLISHYHYNSTDLFYVRASGLIGICIAPLSGLLIKRFGSKKMLIAGFTLTSLGIFFEGQATSIHLIILSSVVFVAGVAISAPALIAHISMNAVKAKGAAISLYTFILFSGAAIGSIFASKLAVYGFKFLSLAIFGMLIVSIILFMIVTNKPATLAEKVRA